MAPASAVRTLVSAADHRFYRTLCQLLLSAERHRATVGFVVADLGLSPADRRHLARRFPWVAAEPFEFDRYPAHVRRLAICAWKPIVIDDVLARRRGRVLWLDAACIIRARLDPVFERIGRDGVLTLVGQSPIRRWCHDGMLRYMHVSAEDAERRCRPAGVVGFDAAREAVRDLVADWRRCALTPDCIDPEGATRATHRWDQAALSNLLYPFERRTGIPLGADEIDISSIAPVRWVSTRNVVAPWVPLSWDPAVRAAWWAWKSLDRAALRARARLRQRAAEARVDAVTRV
ncbi:MAG TPA: hypothetical protein VEU08_00150 [Vicinamibacterales bacterium]|nr:hypothetical protein [Vicinamibacterales bacterium]